MKLVKKALLLIVLVLSLIAAVFVIRFGLGGDEDTWLCQDGVWVKHGNPSASAPPQKECSLIKE